jgi:hypothetical protein
MLEMGKFNKNYRIIFNVKENIDIKILKSIKIKIPNMNVSLVLKKQEMVKCQYKT